MRKSVEIERVTSRVETISYKEFFHEKCNILLKYKNVKKDHIKPASCLFQHLHMQNRHSTTVDIDDDMRQYSVLGRFVYELFIYEETFTLSNRWQGTFFFYQHMWACDFFSADIEVLCFLGCLVVLPKKKRIFFFVVLQNIIIFNRMLYALAEDLLVSVKRNLQ
ncbi:hypothetical protein ACJX0J_022833 [Zea mays]